MRSSEDREYQRVLLALRAQLRGELHLLADLASELMVRQRPSKPQALCRSCGHFWRTSMARQLKALLADLIHHKEERLRQIEAALQRMREGTYDQCQGCGIRLSDRRRALSPHTTYCALCDLRQPSN